MKIALAVFVWFCGEIVVLVKVGQAIDALETLALLLLTSGLGAALLRAEGLAFFGRLAGTMQRFAQTGDLPPVPIADAAPRFLAGALFLLPGFLSDGLAILVLLPPIRGAIARRFRRFIEDQHHQAVARRSFPSFDIEAEPFPGTEGRDDADEDGGRGPRRLPRRLR